VQEYAAPTGSETVLDLYCGAGSIGLSMAHCIEKLIGVESVKDAVLDANRNAVINGIVCDRFLCGKAEEVLPTKLQGVRADIVILDPPRAGCDPKLIESVLAVAAPKLIYVSCNPSTLARDVRLLRAGGYEFVEASPVDMFPHTLGIETVCLLSKLSEVKQHISVQVDMDELDLTAAESKATYEEIQEWVQEKYGFHVTHLNIAQVKRKHGIIERENYNKSKSPDSKQPRCPEDKTRAIEAALKHFQMI
jgi:23S rRNA (uracil1939-C5)-methyltransferase